MFARMHQAPAAAYHSVDIESSVHLTDPHRLVGMLFDGAVTAVMKATMALRNGNYALKGESTTRAIRIIEEGLKASLDPEVGEISANLAMLYDYMTRTLLEANLHGNAEKYEEVTELLKGLRDAWQQIRPQVVNTKVYG